MITESGIGDLSNWLGLGRAVNRADFRLGTGGVQRVKQIGKHRCAARKNSLEFGQRFAAQVGMLGNSFEKGWRRADLKYGEILVAERTDPGWIIVFPSAAGVLVERGSLLSHSAILAREMGIPAIVSISGVTAWLNDGDWVELDGSTGVVSRIDAAAETAHED